MVIFSRSPAQASVAPPLESTLRSTWLRDLGEHDTVLFYDQTVEPAGSLCAHSQEQQRAETEAQSRSRHRLVLQRRVSCALLWAIARFLMSAVFVLVTPSVFVWWGRLCRNMDEMLGQEEFADVPLLIAHAAPRQQVLALKHALANASSHVLRGAFDQLSAYLADD